MQQKSRIEIFSAGCATCNEIVELVQQLAAPTHGVIFRDMKQADGAYRAGSLGIRSVPEIVINGKLVEPSAKGGHDEASLRAAGLGQPLQST